HLRQDWLRPSLSAAVPSALRSTVSLFVAAKFQHERKQEWKAGMTTNNTLSNRLRWRVSGNGFALFYGRSIKPLLHVVPDKTYAGMWRVQYRDGSLSDMARLARARDAGRANALTILHGKSERSISTPEGPQSDLNAGEAA